MRAIPQLVSANFSQVVKNYMELTLVSTSVQLERLSSSIESDARLFL